MNPCFRKTLAAVCLFTALAGAARTPKTPMQPQLQAPASAVDTLGPDARVAPWAVGNAKFAGNGELQMPARWCVPEIYEQTLPSQEMWWKEWDDPILTDLINRAEAQNMSAKAALHRIAMAQDALRQTRAGYLPTVGLNAGYIWERGSGANGAVAVKGDGLSYMNLGANASWEIDLFGRINAQLKSDKAQVSLTKAERNATLVSLCGTLAKTYIQLRTYQAQYELDKAHSLSQEKLVDMTLARQEAGLASALDVAQARQVYYSTKSQLPVLEAQISSTINAISVLTGEYPGTLLPLLTPVKPLPEVFPSNPAIGTPIDMIRRRPDIAQAEARLAMYAAQTGVARKDFLPHLSIAANIGFQAHKFGDLFTDKGLNYSVNPALSWTLFDGRARDWRVAQAREQYEMGLDNYNETVLNAMHEVVSGCNEYKGYNEELSVLDTLIGESRHALKLSVDLYRSSLTPFSNVVDAQVDLLQYESQQIQVSGQAMISLITIYEALGGGY